jgi:hypothetical protein
MKKNKFIIGLLIAAQTVGFSSCTDWLELSPENTIPLSEYWKAKEDVESALTGCYMSLRTTSNYMLLWGEIRADMLMPNKLDADWNLIRRGEISSTNKFCNWNAVYTCINNCNLLLDNSVKAYENDESFTEALLHEYQAQAIAIRSLCYFNLVRTFGDVPFPRTGYINNAQELTMAKTSGTEILTTVAADLQQIVDDFWIPVRYSNTDVAQNKGYMTRYAAQALLADIYLWLERYQESADICNEIINSGQYALMPIMKGYEVTTEGDTVYYAHPSSVAEYFDAVYVKGNSVESIFELQFDRENLNSFYNTFVSGTCTMVPNTEHLVDYFIPTEKEGFERIWVDARESMASKMGTAWKWAAPNYDATITRSSADMENNHIIYRLGQIYLMRAEALCQLGIAQSSQELLAEALALVEVVRDRAGATETTALEVTGEIDGKSLEAHILDEEAREMMYEGKRWFDVIRNAKRNNYANANYLTQIVPYSVITDKSFSVQVKYKDPNSWYMPLPESNIETNSKLEQNPFYDTKKK